MQKDRSSRSKIPYQTLHTWLIYPLATSHMSGFPGISLSLEYGPLWPFFTEALAGVDEQQKICSHRYGAIQKEIVYGQTGPCYCEENHIESGEKAVHWNSCFESHTVLASINYI